MGGFFMGFDYRAQAHKRTSAPERNVKAYKRPNVNRSKSEIFCRKKAESDQNMKEIPPVNGGKFPLKP